MVNFVENLVHKATGLSKLPKPEPLSITPSSLSLLDSSSKFEGPASKINPDIHLISEEVPNAPKEKNEKIFSSESKYVDKSISSISNNSFSLEKQSSLSDEIPRESYLKNLNLKETENPSPNKSETFLDIKAPEPALKNHPDQSASSEIQSSMQNDSSEILPEKKSRSIQPEVELGVSKKNKIIPSPLLESPEEDRALKLDNMNNPEDKALRKTTAEQTLTKEIPEKIGIHESTEIKSRSPHKTLNVKETESLNTNKSFPNFEIPSLRTGTKKQDLLSIPPETYTKTPEELSLFKSEKMTAQTLEKGQKNRTSLERPPKERKVNKSTNIPINSVQENPNIKEHEDSNLKKSHVDLNDKQVRNDSEEQLDYSISPKLNSSIKNNTQENRSKKMKHPIEPERKKEIQSTSNEITDKNEILNASQKRSIHTINIEPAPTNRYLESINNLSKRINLNSSFPQPQQNMIKSTGNQHKKEVRVNIGRVEIKASRPVQMQRNPPVRDFNDYLMKRMYLDRNYF